MESSEEVPDVEDHLVADDVAAVPESSKSTQGQEVQNSSSEETEVPEQSIQAGNDDDVIAKPSEENVDDGEDVGDNKYPGAVEAVREETVDKSKQRIRKSKSSSEDQIVAEETVSVSKRTLRGRNPTKASQKLGEKLIIVNDKAYPMLQSSN